MTEEKIRGGSRPGAGRKISSEGPRMPHALRFTNAAWDRIIKNSQAEGYKTVTSFIEAKTAY